MTAAVRHWHFGNERWVLSQFFAARIELARRDPSAARAAIVAALVWQQADAMRAVTHRQHAETVIAGLRRRAKRDDGGRLLSQRPP